MKERFEKLSELWQNLPSSKKLTLGVALVGIIGLSIGILSWSGESTQMRVLVSGADSKDLAEVVDIL
ncbi:MAG TPA: flagellar M-ring protein FliF, partial [Opitutae bacterium]|nr:flagellar M-ring protein FliF [Opitutae bacterium]